MAETFRSRLKHAWDVFKSRDPTKEFNYLDLGPSTSYKPSRTPFRITNERSIIISVYNRIAMDVSSVQIQHVRFDQNGSYEDTIMSGLNNILNQEANIDQTSTAFIQDIVMSMFDEGVIAVVPVDTTLDPEKTGGYDIQTMRTGPIIEWYPQHVKVRLYNDKTGLKEELILKKSIVAIIENPLYSVMNEPNSTLKRLVRKLNILDAIDEQSGSGKLDLIIQLPYVIKSEAKRQQADQRRKDVEMQLAGSKYGIAYIDGTERVTQLNRAAENNLMTQIQYLTSMLYSQLGLTEDVFTGKADEQTMLNYQSRTIDPIVRTITEEFERKFLTKTARSQHQGIMSFKNPFSLVTAENLANVADKLTRNEILSSNEVRAIIGYKPSKDPKADKLENKNINRGVDSEEVIKVEKEEQK